MAALKQKTFFDDAEPVAVAPIARRSDPVTSHEAAAKTESVRTELQAMCLGLWVKTNAAMTVKEVAAEIMRRCFPEIKKTDERYPTQLDNCRKRANEVANKHCIKLQERRDGCRVFRIKESWQQ
jgi:hypothetical protein